MHFPGAGYGYFVPSLFTPMAFSSLLVLLLGELQKQGLCGIWKYSLSQLTTMLTSLRSTNKLSCHLVFFCKIQAFSLNRRHFFIVGLPWQTSSGKTAVLECFIHTNVLVCHWFFLFCFFKKGGFRLLKNNNPFLDLY